jgi:hypothetical protein
VSLLWAKRGWLTPGSQTIRTLERFGASDAWDFVDNSYMRAGHVTTNSGLTVTRASEGYAETSDGRLVEFGSGVLRRTDRGALIEEARTNLLLRSQEFNDAAWTNSNITVTANAIVAPDGTATADLLTAASSTSVNIQQTVSLSATVASASVFAKKGSGATEANTFRLRNTTTASNLLVITVNYDTGAITYTTGSAGATMQSLGNGWWRITLSASSGITSGDNIRFDQCFIGPATSGQNAYVWGAQLEAAASPSSYIATEGSTATRASDIVYATGLSGTGAQTLFAETGTKSNTGGPAVVWYSNGLAGTNNRMFILRASSDAEARAFMASNGSIQAQQNFGTWTGDPQKFAARFNTDDVRGAAGGVLGTADTTATLPVSTLDYFAFGGDGSTASLFGYLRRTAIIPLALTDAQLQGITT